MGLQFFNETGVVILLYIGEAKAARLNGEKNVSVEIY